MTAVLEPRVVTTTELLASDLHRALSVISHFASTDATIPMLCQVRLEGDGEGKLVAVATDRYSLGTLTVPYHGPAFATGIELRDVKALLPGLKRLHSTYRDAVVTFKLTDDRTWLALSYYDHESRIRVYEHDYPKWRALIPEIKPGSCVDAIAVNPVQLAKFAKAAESKTEPMRMYFTTPMKPVRVEIGEQFTGLIMPMRMGT